MKRFICALLAVTLLVGVAACAFGEETGAWKFERPVTIVCPWGAGGGADRTIRPMAELLTKILGVDVKVINIVGHDGANGVEYVYRNPADGYIFLLGTQSMFMLDMQGITSMNFKTEFLPVARLVHAVNIFAGSKRAMKEKGYNSFSEMLEYLKREPGDINIGMLASTGLDGAVENQTFKNLEVLAVPYPSGHEMNMALVRGDVDMIIAGTDELEELIKTGEVVPLLAVSEKRLKKFPDMECTVELGINSVLGPARGIYAKRGTPEAAIKALELAVKQASSSQEWQEFLEKGSYDEREAFADAQAFAQANEADYKLLSAYLKDAGKLKINYFK